MCGVLVSTQNTWIHGSSSGFQELCDISFMHHSAHCGLCDNCQETHLSSSSQSLGVFFSQPWVLSSSAHGPYCLHCWPPHPQPLDVNRYPREKLFCSVQAESRFASTVRLCTGPLQEIREADKQVSAYFPPNIHIISLIYPFQWINSEKQYLAHLGSSDLTFWSFSKS